MMQFMMVELPIVHYLYREFCIIWSMESNQATCLLPHVQVTKSSILNCFLQLVQSFNGRTCVGNAQPLVVYLPNKRRVKYGFNPHLTHYNTSWIAEMLNFNELYLCLFGKLWFRFKKSNISQTLCAL